MSNTTKYTVGQEFVLAPYGNFARRMTATTRAITKVGRKYFYIGDYAFDINTGEFVDDHEYNGGFYLYPSMEAYQEELTAREQERVIRDCFNKFGRSDIPNEAINEIYSVLKRYGVITF